MSQLYSVTVQAPAKLNLSLDVVGLLPGGYHSLDMIMQAVTLYERVELHRSAQLTLTLPGSTVSAGADNTALKAARAFFDYTGLEGGADILVYKSVPVRAGMAGGSADAAAVLVGLNTLYDAKLSFSELCALGAGIGADVPFALMGGTCRVQGCGGSDPCAASLPGLLVHRSDAGIWCFHPGGFCSLRPHRCIPSAGLRRPGNRRPRRQPGGIVRSCGQCAGGMQRRTRTTRPSKPCCASRGHRQP